MHNTKLWKMPRCIEAAVSAVLLSCLSATPSAWRSSLLQACRGHTLAMKHRTCMRALSCCMRVGVCRLPSAPKGRGRPYMRSDDRSGSLGMYKMARVACNNKGNTSTIVGATGVYCLDLADPTFAQRCMWPCAPDVDARPPMDTLWGTTPPKDDVPYRVRSNRTAIRRSRVAGLPRLSVLLKARQLLSNGALCRCALLRALRLRPDGPGRALCPVRASLRFGCRVGAEALRACWAVAS